MWAEQVLASEPADTPARARMADWSPEMERLTDLYDLVGEVMRLLIALKGGKPNRSRPLPRPRTALDRLRARRRERQHRSIVARVLPHAAGEERPSA